MANDNYYIPSGGIGEIDYDKFFIVTFFDRKK